MLNKLKIYSIVVTLLLLCIGGYNLFNYLSLNYYQQGYQEGMLYTAEKQEIPYLFYNETINNRIDQSIST